jgi:hypothetical protein
MNVRFKARAIVDAATVAKEGDELDVAIPVARALIAQGIAESLEPVLETSHGLRRADAVSRTLTFREA